MATIKISDLHSSLSISFDQEEFIEAVSGAVTRALDARQLQDIRGGLESPILAGYWETSGQLV